MTAYRPPCRAVGANTAGASAFAALRAAAGRLAAAGGALTAGFANRAAAAEAYSCFKDNGFNSSDEYRLKRSASDDACRGRQVWD